MQKSLLVVALLAFSSLAIPQAISSAQPLLPDAGITMAAEATTTPNTTTPAVTDTQVPAPATQAAPSVEKVATGPERPTRLSIPSIGLSDAIVPVGLNSLGDMAVPSGASSNVGWYKDGTFPGDVGSAVLDAHVFAAFAKLNKVSEGDDIYVSTSNGQRLHFTVVAIHTYKLSDLTPDILFNQNDARRLNLITCAGQLTPDHSTYDHRLVIYAVLAQ